ncbi:MAG TPA: hypothetical protein ENK18_12465 [Deltaproteobacteria bacterium]|nr:hypothetical protein [Deltaproteobacteria bacterium]
MSRSILLLCSGLVACQPPDPAELFNALTVDVIADPAEAEARFVEAVGSASDSLHVALPDGDNTELLEALGDAWSSGVEVELVIDHDQREDPGVVALIDAGLQITLADAGLTYFEFNLNDEVTWASTDTIMSHAYVISDRQRLLAATTAGHLRSGPRILVSFRGEEILEDYLIEHNQIYGGIDATAVTAFDSPAKSIADFRWRYGTDTPTDLEVWFGPQERLTKRVIDAVYSARSAVWVLTNELANDGLARALQDKAAFGFDVRVVVGPAFRSTSQRLADELLQDTPDVQKVQIDSVEDVPTLILVDLPPDQEGYPPHARAMILTHDLVSSARLYRGQTVVTDQLIDGAMWVLSNRTPERTELLGLDALFQEQFDLGEAL